MSYTILFGGASFEHEISIVSAICLKKVLEKSNAKEPCEFVFLDGARNFYHIDPQNMNSKYFATGGYKKAEKLILMHGGFAKMGLLGHKKLIMPMILNLIHGGDGEDGKIAALLDFYSLEYIGPRLFGCAVSFDKELTKDFAKARGVSVLEGFVVRKERDFNTIDRALNNLKAHLPLIVKPARLGSSIGISIARDENELKYALEVAFEFDNKLVCERFVSGIKEYNLAGAKTKDGFVFSIIEEPQKAEILDFDKKYLDFSRTSSAQEAQISQEIAEKIKTSFVKLYENAFEGALIRCDFFEKDGEIFLNEINPIPGSLANYLFADFAKTLNALSAALTREKQISVKYNYLEKIAFSKGK